MTFEEICDQAIALEETILELQFTKTEAVALLAILEARLMKRICKDEKPAIIKEKPKVEEAPTEKEKPVIPPKFKGIRYDPLHDPAPPFSPEPVPARDDAPSGKVIAQKNTACICSGCNKVVYTTNMDIQDSMKVVDFIAAFTPTDDSVPPLNRSMEIQNIDGNISCDCPNCSGVKTLYLVGRKPMGT